MPEENTIMLPEPDAGSSLHFTMRPEQVYRLGFAPETSTFEAIGQDVQVQFESGAILVLHDFFPVAEQGDFMLELRDGALLSGRDMAEVLSMSLEDFHTDLGSAAIAGNAVLTAVSAAQEAAGAMGTGASRDETRPLALEEVLDAPQSLLFADAPEKNAPPAPVMTSGADGAEEQAASHLSCEGQNAPEASDDPSLLALLRLDIL